MVRVVILFWELRKKVGGGGGNSVARSPWRRNRDIHFLSRKKSKLLIMLKRIMKTETNNCHWAACPCFYDFQNQKGQSEIPAAIWKRKNNPDMKHNRGPTLESVDTELLNWISSFLFGRLVDFFSSCSCFVFSLPYDRQRYSWEAKTVFSCSNKNTGH